MAVEYEERYELSDEKYEEILDLLSKEDFTKEEKSQKDVVFIKDEHIIRVRIEKDGCSIDYKKYLDEKRWEEISVPISKEHVKKAIGIFERILPLNKIVVKKRVRFSKGDVEIALDNLKGVGKFIEIEGPKEEVEYFVKKFGLNNKPIAKPYGLYLDELKNKGKIDYDLEKFDVIVE